jgi:hypothetical protein
MIDQPDRVEQFRGEIASMGLRDPAANRERMLLRLGGLLLLVGPVVSVAAFFWSHSSVSPLDQNDAQVLAMAGVAVAIAGAALFVRYSMANFLRFWLARLSHEQAAQAAALADTLSGPGPAAAAPSTPTRPTTSAGGTSATSAPSQAAASS